MNAATGTIAGTPTEAGTTDFTIRVRDASQCNLQQGTEHRGRDCPDAHHHLAEHGGAGPGGRRCDTSVELGVKFRSDVAGTITGIRFYKASANTGTHVGNLWSSTGTLLATATFTNETASGWQQVAFSSPVAITADTVYVASYHAERGHYSADVNYFATPGWTTRHCMRSPMAYRVGTACMPTVPQYLPIPELEQLQLLGRCGVPPNGAGVD